MNVNVFFIVNFVLFYTITSNTVEQAAGIGYPANHIFSQSELYGAIDKAYIKQFLPHNAIIVEAGGYRGEDTLEMAQSWQDLLCTIHTFEPLPHLWSALKQKCAPYPVIQVHHYALAESNGIKTLHISSGRSDASSSLLEPKDHLKNYPDVYFNHTIDVETITLDSWAQQNSIDHVDFLWLDLQGYEARVLRSCPHILKTVKVILCEVQLTQAYAGCELYPALKSWLEEQGFEVVRENFLGSVNEGNVLFVRRNH
ncbi:MAG TPA: FkbM family methyltransferase [Candidatus Babeliaceae bacterium]|nr:FkbM family methyltransferase [Candidatus Babeliaceae bacterium]